MSDARVLSNPEYINSMNELLTHIRDNISHEAFPGSYDEALANNTGDSILSGMAIEIVQGSEDTPEEEMRERAIVLMERVRDDLNEVIEAIKTFGSDE